MKHDKKYTTVNPNFSIHSLLTNRFVPNATRKLENLHVFFLFWENFCCPDARVCFTRDILQMISVIQLVEKITLCIYFYIIIRVHSAFSLVASCVLLKYTRTDDVN